MATSDVTYQPGGFYWLRDKYRHIWNPVRADQHGARIVLLFGDPYAGNPVDMIRLAGDTFQSVPLSLPREEAAVLTTEFLSETPDWTHFWMKRIGSASWQLALITPDGDLDSDQHRTITILFSGAEDRSAILTPDDCDGSVVVDILDEPSASTPDFRMFTKWGLEEGSPIYRFMQNRWKLHDESHRAEVLDYIDQRCVPYVEGKRDLWKLMWVRRYIADVEIPESDHRRSYFIIRNP